MPTYDYFCETNGQRVEVAHKMSESINSWGELCQRAGIEPGETSLDTPVRKVISGGAVIGSSALKNPEPPPSCGSGGCGGGMCGL